MTLQARPNQTPTLGRIVLYRASHPSAGVVPAVVVSTVLSAREYPTADVESPAEGHVHLAQFSPSASQQLGTTYIARDVPEDEAIGGLYTEDEHTPGTWRWPPLR